MDSYIAVSIAVVGWIAAHVLSLRAQRRNLRLQVTDRARSEATLAVRAAQSWAVKVGVTVMLLDTAFRLEALGVPVDWKSECDKVLALIRDSPTDWVRRLEEYEIVFPETAAVRERLGLRQKRISERVGALYRGLMQSTIIDRSRSERERLIVEAEAWVSDVHDQTALLEDLLVHLQNQALGPVMGRSIPARVPRDESLPKITRGSDGLLWIQPDRPEPLVRDETSAITAAQPIVEG